MPQAIKAMLVALCFFFERNKLALVDVVTTVVRLGDARYVVNDWATVVDVAVVEVTVVVLDVTVVDAP